MSLKVIKLPSSVPRKLGTTAGKESDKVFLDRVFVFGNPDLIEDSLPLRILPRLRDNFPNIVFEIKDPNEEWEMSGGDEEGSKSKPNLVVLDTVVGISDVKVFENLKKFSAAPRVSMHDFDALANLRFLQKLGKVGGVKVIGVPQSMSEEEVIVKVTEILKTEVRPRVEESRN